MLPLSRDDFVIDTCFQSKHPRAYVSSEVTNALTHLTKQLRVKTGGSISAPSCRAFVQRKPIFCRRRINIHVFIRSCFHAQRSLPIYSLSIQLIIYLVIHLFICIFMCSLRMHSWFHRLMVLFSRYSFIPLCSYLAYRAFMYLLCTDLFMCCCEWLMCLHVRETSWK